MKQLTTLQSPFFDLPSLQRFAVGFDQVFDDLQRRSIETVQSNFPPYNIIKIGESAYAIEIAVAGFSEEELSLELVKGELVVKGQQQEEIGGLVGAILNQDRTFLHRGIAARNFIRTFALADTMEVVGATVKNGILLIKLEHVVPEEDKPRAIPITFANK